MPLYSIMLYILYYIILYYIILFYIILYHIIFMLRWASRQLHRLRHRPQHLLEERGDDVEVLKTGRDRPEVALAGGERVAAFFR